MGKPEPETRIISRPALVRQQQDLRQPLARQHVSASRRRLFASARAERHRFGWLDRALVVVSGSHQEQRAAGPQQLDDRAVIVEHVDVSTEVVDEAR